jgi:AraC family transcriptional activator of pyochelin receptor
MAVTLTRRDAHGLQLTHAMAEYDGRGARRGSSDDDVVRLHFGLRGLYSVRYAPLERTFDRMPPHFSLFYANPFELEFENQTPVLETFGVAFPVDRFIEYAAGSSREASRFCERISAGKPGFLREPTPALSPMTEATIRAMLAPRFDGALEALFLLSQSLELLVVALDSTDEGARVRVVKRRGDRDRVVAARELIDARLTSPPKLAEVARAVGLNEYKLKRGFKELFGTTVFGHLAARRLDLARRMLRDTDETAAEIAYALGYKTPQHFSAAFKRRFGTSPNRMRKNP